MQFVGYNVPNLFKGDASAPGNYGLWDIHAALTWVKENIAAFAGDPNKITIFGQSAGGSLTSHSVISPKMDGLFQSAIAVSGASSGFFGVTTQALRTAVMLADIFNCTDVNTPADIVTCLRAEEARAVDFWGVVAAVTHEGRLPNLLPVVDGDIMPFYPEECFRMGYGWLSVRLLLCFRRVLKSCTVQIVPRNDNDFVNF